MYVDLYRYMRIPTRCGYSHFTEIVKHIYIVEYYKYGHVYQWTIHGSIFNLFIAMLVVGLSYGTTCLITDSYWFYNDYRKSLPLCQ